MLDAVILSIGLAMDATAVAAARGAAGVGLSGAVKMAVTFGVFQSGMSAGGWAAGAGAARWVERWDHWIAFVLLALIGGKMLVEASRREDDEELPPLGWGSLLLLGIATSIDAAAAGVTLPLLSVSAPVSLALIGGVTAGLSFAGAKVGSALGERLGKVLEVVGGLALIGIGTKILLEHLL